MKLKFCLGIILLSTFVVGSKAAYGWRDISIELRRAIGSAYSAANFLNVQFTEMISAQERINPAPNTNEYRVEFKATTSESLTKYCKADVKWDWTPTLVRTVSNAGCLSQRTTV